MINIEIPNIDIHSYIFVYDNHFHFWIFLVLNPNCEYTYLWLASSLFGWFESWSWRKIPVVVCFCYLNLQFLGTSLQRQQAFAILCDVLCGNLAKGLRRVQLEDKQMVSDGWKGCGFTCSINSTYTHIYIYIAIILGTNVIVGSIWYTFYWQPLMKIVGSLLFNTHPRQFHAGFTVSTYIEIQLTWPLTCWAKHGLLDNSTFSSMILLANILTPPFCSAISQQVTFDDTGRYTTLIVHIILYIHTISYYYTPSANHEKHPIKHPIRFHQSPI